MAENIVTAYRTKDRASIRTAIFFVPLWLYDNAMFIVYWRSLLGAVRREARVWIT